MRRLLVCAALALTLTGCGVAGMLAGIPASPREVAQKTTLDERSGLAVETIYAATARAGALAFRLGIVKPSSDPAVQTNDFCPRVMAGYEPTDRGGDVMALECRLRAVRDKSRSAYRAGNADDYNQAEQQARAIAAELLALTREN